MTMNIPRTASQLSVKNTSQSPPVCRCAIHIARKKMAYNTMQTTMVLIISNKMRCKFHLRGCSLSMLTKRTETQMLHANMPNIDTANMDRKVVWCSIPSVNISGDGMLMVTNSPLMMDNINTGSQVLLNILPKLSLIKR